MKTCTGGIRNGNNLTLASGNCPDLRCILARWSGSVGLRPRLVWTRCSRWLGDARKNVGPKMVTWWKKHKHTALMTFWFVFTLYHMVNAILYILAGIAIWAVISLVCILCGMYCTTNEAKIVYAEQESR